MWWRVDFLMAISLVVRWLGGDMTVNGVKIAILGTALHVHHTFWDIYLPPLNYFDVNFPDFKISEGWKHNETIFYSFSVLYLDAALESLTSEKTFFAKLGSVFLFKVAEHSFAGDQRWLAWRRVFKLRQTNMAAKKKRRFPKSNH